MFRYASLNCEIAWLSECWVMRIFKTFYLKINIYILYITIIHMQRIYTTYIFSWIIVLMLCDYLLMHTSWFIHQHDTYLTCSDYTFITKRMKVSIYSTPYINVPVFSHAYISYEKSRHVCKTVLKIIIQWYKYASFWLIVRILCSQCVIKLFSFLLL